jgi:hypothetical protein
VKLLLSLDRRMGRRSQPLTLIIPHNNHTDPVDTL